MKSSLRITSSIPERLPRSMDSRSRSGAESKRKRLGKMLERNLGPDKEPVDHWEAEFGFQVSNPIGWMRRGIEFDRPLTADAFLVMSGESIVKIEDYDRMINTGAIELPDLTAGGSENE